MFNESDLYVMNKGEYSLTKFRRRWFNLESTEFGLIMIGGLMLFSLMVLVSADVFMRNVFNAPIQVSFKLSELLMCFIVFLGFAWTQREGGFVRIELLISRLSTPVRSRFDYVNYILSIGFFIVFSWQSVLIAWDALVRGETTHGLISLPVWPARAAIAIGSIFLLAELMVGLVRHCRGKI